MACSSAPEPKDEEVTPGESAADEVDTEETEETGEEDSETPRRAFWGRLQGRADEAFEKLEDEIGECLKQLDDDDRVREIAFRARRDGLSGYEIEALEARPTDGVDEACVEESTQRFVDAVGASLRDEYDEYLVTFIARPEPGAACDSGAGDIVCADLQVEGSGKGDPSSTGECEAQLSDAVQDAVREANHCRSPRRFDDHFRQHEDEPLRRRSVLLTEVIVDEGGARVVIRYNQPWVGALAECVAEEVAILEVHQSAHHGACRSVLNNYATSYSMKPTFTFVVDY